MKKLLFLLCTALLLVGCTAQSTESPPPADNRLQVVATLFPQYDFARRIAGEHAAVQLLLPPGAESHTFDPSPADVIAVSKADLFIYTGASMEPWAENMLAGLDRPVKTVDLSAGATLGSPESDPLNLIAFAGEHEGHAHVKPTARDPVELPAAGSHDHLYDPHLWTSPVLARGMVAQIRDSLSAADPANTTAYQENAAALDWELAQLDEQFRTLISQSDHREVVFGSRFAVYYFAREYGLSFLSPYDSCSGETEPSARTLAQVIDFVQEHEIPVVYYQELSETRVAETIAEATGARTLLFHSCHNVTHAELAAGETYLSLMQGNLTRLQEGLL